MVGHGSAPVGSPAPAPGGPGLSRAAWRGLAAAVGLGLFAAVLGVEAWVLWAWQAKATRESEGAGAPGVEDAGGWPIEPLPSEQAVSGQTEPVGRLAIVIDDWGYGWAAAQAILELQGPLTLAVIPHLPKSVQQAEAARRQGHEVLVHLPMEPLDARLDPGRGAVTSALADEEIRRRVEAAIRGVPGAVGVSNHMGSRATSDRRVMEQVLAVVAGHGLFFLDSATSPSSVVGQVARRLGVSSVRNRVFLDSQPDADFVKAQLWRAGRLALRDGEAVAIGHVRPQTAEARRAVLPELRRMGIQLVPVSALAQRSGGAARVAAGR